VKRDIVKLRKGKALATYALDVLSRLKRAYPDAHCELDHETPLQLLVATILSAQCTDKRVNMVTPSLFQTFPTAASLADAPQTGETFDEVSVPVLTPRESKGLEFDHVIVVEPALIVEEGGDSGLRELYVALTRPTKTLIVVHARPLPDALE